MDLSKWGVKEEQIKEFRDWLNKQENLPDVPDEYLARFLHSCYFNLEKAEKVLECYLRLKLKAPELFTDRTLDGEEIAMQLDSFELGVLPNTTDRGYSVMWGRMKEVPPSSFHPDVGVKLLYMTVDRILQERKGCPGIIFVYDMANLGLRHLFRTSLSTIRNYFEYVQEAAPMRHKSIHLINVGSLTTYIMGLIKPFVYKEHLKKLHFHPTNAIEGIFEDIRKEDVPSDYGGNGPPMSKVNVDNIEGIKALSDWFKFDETLKYAEPKKNKKTTGTNQLDTKLMTID